MSCMASDYIFPFVSDIDDVERRQSCNRVCISQFCPDSDSPPQLELFHHQDAPEVALPAAPSGGQNTAEETWSCIIGKQRDIPDH
ncbi:hypothetical protein HAX54_048480 [Datura stramonium]|uniref:Uncharacterized protein n=1 Tax=Datura stramonium TaxID=4076 RepID=A0ABS8RQM2_DATST|nr:hypothetical protein [Datura stramonium]